jgi:hypothetical protein
MHMVGHPAALNTIPVVNCLFERIGSHHQSLAGSARILLKIRAGALRKLALARSMQSKVGSLEMATFKDTRPPLLVSWVRHDLFVLHDCMTLLSTHN